MQSFTWNVSPGSSVLLFYDMSGQFFLFVDYGDLYGIIHQYIIKFTSMTGRRDINHCARNIRVEAVFFVLTNCYL